MSSKRFVKSVLVVFLALLALAPVHAQTFTVLYSFKGGTTDGAHPGWSWTPVVFAGGNVYGTTIQGGSANCYGGLGCGVLFKVTVATGKEKILHAFQGTTDGSSPAAILKAGAAIYGNTEGGSGTLYKWTSTVFTNFSGLPGYPTGLLARDAAGNIYGTTMTGGGSNVACPSSGCGTVYKISSTGTVTVLHNFAGPPSDGMMPFGVIRDAAGNLYGTTSGGGSQCPALYGCGIVYKITSAGTFGVLYNFAGGRRAVSRGLGARCSS